MSKFEIFLVLWGLGGWIMALAVTYSKRKFEVREESKKDE